MTNSTPLLFCLALIYVGACGTGVGTTDLVGEEDSLSAGTSDDDAGQTVPDLPPSDTDRDGIADVLDRCPGTALNETTDSTGCSASQRDSDGDGFSDADEVNFIPGTDPFDAADNPNNVRDSDADGCSDFDEMNFEGFCDNDPNTRLPDADSDGIPDDDDNCLTVPNSDQADSDGDSFGDACDICIGGDDRFDLDADGVPDDCDACPFTFDPDQLDSDGDGTGDACELFFDFDADGVDDSVDNCILFPNPDQTDTDGDGTGDACELFFDFDADGVDDSVDNCILFPNPDQTDTDGDGLGDACEIPVPPPVVVESFIIADDGQFLGVISSNSFDPDSIANQFGMYGNPFSSLSIWNEFGTYGSNFSFLSPWNDFSVTPPLVFEGDVFVGYLTTNAFRTPRIDPNDLAILVGRPEETRP